MTNIDLHKYAEFVDAVTSEESKKSSALEPVMRELSKHAIMPRLLTAGIGLSSETGEFNEIIKKCMFQGKPMDEDTLFHMKRELGDVIWYWTHSCFALNAYPNDIIQMNIDKLDARYPGGKFAPHYSVIRVDGDV